MARLIKNKYLFVTMLSLGNMNIALGKRLQISFVHDHDRKSPTRISAHVQHQAISDLHLAHVYVLLKPAMRLDRDVKARACVARICPRCNS